MNDLDMKNGSDKAKSGDLVSFDECKRYLDKFNLSDEEIQKIRNGLIGITNSVINSYLDEFDKH